MHPVGAVAVGFSQAVALPRSDSGSESSLSDAMDSHWDGLLVRSNISNSVSQISQITLH